VCCNVIEFIEVFVIAANARSVFSRSKTKSKDQILHHFGEINPTSFAIIKESCLTLSESIVPPLNVVL